MMITMFTAWRAEVTDLTSLIENIIIATVYYQLTYDLSRTGRN